MKEQYEHSGALTLDTRVWRTGSAEMPRLMAEGFTSARLPNSTVLPAGRQLQTRILMPDTGVLLRERAVELADIRKAAGFRFSPRLHVEL
jgi:hypothetical protein